MTLTPEELKIKQQYEKIMKLKLIEKNSFFYRPSTRHGKPVLVKATFKDMEYQVDKQMSIMNNIVDHVVDNKILQSKDCRQDGLQHGRHLYRPITKPDTSESWIVISTKIKATEKNKFQNLVTKNNLTIAQALKGYVDHMVDSNDK
ncbi:MAG: hypothetical protein LBS76_05030 [Mycoplasmataceae bacterium]|jgi:hypothetical protein|nr:hypothetical protein [Mycoplasmataceae bacterium]